MLNDGVFEMQMRLLHFYPLMSCEVVPIVLFKEKTAWLYEKLLGPVLYSWLHLFAILLNFPEKSQNNSNIHTFLEA